MNELETVNSAHNDNIKHNLSTIQ